MTLHTRPAANRSRLPMVAVGSGLLVALAGLLLSPGVPAAQPVAPTAQATAGILPPTITALMPIAAPRTLSNAGSGTATPEPVAPEFRPAAASALARPIRYAALGASDAVGIGTADPARQNWTARVRAQLPPDTVYHRFARSGITLYEATGVEVPAAIAFRPNLITIWLVVNDVLRGVPLPVFEKELKATLDRLMAQTGAQILLLNVPDIEYMLPPTSTPQTRREMRSVATAWNAGVAATVAPYGRRVEIIDLFGPSQAAPSHMDWISADGFHPSAAGYERIADLTVAALRARGLVP